VNKSSKRILSRSPGPIGWLRRMSRSEAIIAAVVGALISGFFAVVVVIIQEPSSTVNSPPGLGSEPGIGMSPSDTQIATFTPSDQANMLSVPKSYLGLWQGTVANNDNDGTPPEPIKLTVTGGRLGATVGDDSYPTVSCTGSLSLESSKPTEIILGETDSKNGCVSATIVLALDGSELTISEYTGAVAGTPNWSGVLSSVKSFS
jgi:hypothetical protein